MEKENTQGCIHTPGVSTHIVGGTLLLTTLQISYHLFVYAPTHPSIHSSTNPCMHASIHPSIIQAPTHPHMHPSIHAPTHPFMHSSVHASTHPCPLFYPSIHTPIHHFATITTMHFSMPIPTYRLIHPSMPPISPTHPSTSTPPPIACNGNF